MSDILHRFLVMARRRDGSALRRLFLADEPLLESGVEQLVEGAAARVVVTSQHERVRQKTVTVPESRHRAVRFVQTIEPNRPTPGQFERRSESFPLSESLKISRCRKCSGDGRVTCGRCFGRGQDPCRSCRGSGKVSDHGERRRTCGSCGGAGATACRSCAGAGQRPCRVCQGEGQLATWREVVFDYRLENRTADRYPVAKPAAKIRQAFAAWLRINSDEVADFEPRTVSDHLGYETPLAHEVVSTSEQDRLRLVGDAQKSKDTYLFHKTTRSLVPVGYSVLRRAGQAATYWLVGRGEKARELTPAGRLDGFKTLGWLSLGPWAAYSYQGLVQSFGLSDLLWELPALAELSATSLALGSASFGALMLAGLRRWMARPSRVATVGLFHPTGEPTSLLPCLAYLGSYTGRLSVVDRAYTTQTERLLGEPRPAHRSETLAVELTDGRRVYLIEVAQPHELPDSELKGLLGALDGAVVFEGEKEGEDEGSVLESRLRSLGDEFLQISTARLDRNPTARLDRDPEAELEVEALPLEALRTAFVEHFRADLDWHKLFESLWQPVQLALGSFGLEPSESPESSEFHRPSTSREVAHQLSRIESHEPAVEVQESVVSAPQEFDESADSWRRGLREELPHRDPGAVHLAS